MERKPGKSVCTSGGGAVKAVFFAVLAAGVFLAASAYSVENDVAFEPVPASGPALHVQSYNIPGDGVSIASATGHSGITDYVRYPGQGAWVVLTAPSTATSGADTYSFVRWWFNGYAIGIRTINFSLTGTTWAVAEYKLVPKYTLSVYASGVPESKAPISSTTGHGGATTYTKSVLESTWVVLTAPETCGDGDYRFVCWWYSGYSSAIASETINFSMSSDTWAVAVYEEVPYYHGYVYSTGFGGAVPVPISSATGHAGITPFGGEVRESTWVVLTAPATVSCAYGNFKFLCWWYSGYSGAISSQTINFLVSGDVWAVAEYEKIVKRRLDVVSFPVTGLSIAGTHSGTTNYSKPTYDGQWVSLTAPSMWGAYGFVRWWYNGYQISSRTVNFVVSSDTTLAAEYEIDPKAQPARLSPAPCPSDL